MPSLPRSAAATSCAALVLLAAGCAREKLQPSETFSWCAQPIAFSPPPPKWQREGERSGGLLGVRFVLTGGLGQCITVATISDIAERDRSAAIESLIVHRESLSRREFLDRVSLARARIDDPITSREAEAAIATNDALNRALTDYLADQPVQAHADLDEALRASKGLDLTLADVLPRIRLRPDRMQEPERWRIGYERDTTLAGHPAFASDDTLITPDRPLLYHEVFWVVNRCAFKATFQGTRKSLRVFERLVDSIAFPEAPRDSTG